MNLKIRDLKLPDALFIFLPVLFVYLITLYPTVGTEDSGELITSAATLDIAHPSGYPLHTLLGKLFTILIPFGNIGWRVNFMSAFFGALTITLLYLILKKTTKNEILALCFSTFYAFTDIFWSQSIRTEVYSLNSFFLILLIYLALLFNEKHENKYLYLIALTAGLSLTNSHLIILSLPPLALFILISKPKIFISPKKILSSLALFCLGLSIYAYLPIRTSMGPYTNPAYIEHKPLNTWDNFMGFVNRKIYGGTINIDKLRANDDAQNSEVANIISEAIETVSDYGKRFVTNNLSDFAPFITRASQELFFLPFFLFLPGFAYLYKKNKKFFLLILGLALFYSCIQLIYTGFQYNMHPYNIFSSRPFFMPITIILAIVCGSGFQLILEVFTPKKILITSMILGLLPAAALATNFYANNESQNYIAYDFSKALLQSLPPNAYLLSTGRDNLTFPLYYLREIEHERPDITLEIYYGKDAVTKTYLDNKLAEKNLKTIFIDLLPTSYLPINLKPYNFAYVYGDTSGLPPETKMLQEPIMHGIRKKMDFPNGRLKGLYLLKIALSNGQNLKTRDAIFEKIKSELADHEQFKNFIKDYLNNKDDTGMF